MRKWTPEEFGYKPDDLLQVIATGTIDTAQNFISEMGGVGKQKRILSFNLRTYFRKLEGQHVKASN